MLKSETDSEPVVSFATWQIGIAALLVFWFAMQLNAASAFQKETVPADPAIAPFNERVKQYVELRKKAQGRPSKLSSKSTPEQIEAHKAALQASIIAARTDAKPGDIFTPDIARFIRRAIRQEFKGERLRQLRANIREAQTKGVPVRANVPYPETTELVDMPPTLLLALPALPKELHYRFVGGYLLLIDKEARLIVDVMPAALPRPTSPAR